MDPFCGSIFWIHPVLWEGATERVWLNSLAEAWTGLLRPGQRVLKACGIESRKGVLLRASGSGRRPQRRMARLQISGHYAYPAVCSDVTQRRTCVLERPQPARCIECHADSLSCPLTQLYIPGVPGRVQRGSGVQRLCNQP